MQGLTQSHSGRRDERPFPLVDRTCNDIAPGTGGREQPELANAQSHRITPWAATAQPAHRDREASLRQHPAPQGGHPLHAERAHHGQHAVKALLPRADIETLAHCGRQ